MPKVNTPPQFDAEGIVRTVHSVPIGLRCTTNNPEAFRQLVYKAAAKLNLKVHIYSYPQAPNSFAVLKTARPQQEPANAHS